MTKALPEEARARLVEMIPAGSVREPRGHCAHSRFPRLGRARYITGQVIEVNGGLHM